MGLPKLEHPTFELTIPSTKDSVRYRPFLVKEEKILLIAQQSGEPNEFIQAILQVLQNCMMDYDVRKLTNFDTEYAFLKLRANSISESVKINVLDDETEDYVEIEVDLNEVECPDVEQSNLIKLNDEVSIEMRYPRYTDLLKIDVDDNIETSLELISACIDKIYNGEEVLALSDFSMDEQTDFINSFPADSFNELQTFFTEMPKVTMKVKYKIKIDGKQKTKTKILEGINDFF